MKDELISFETAKLSKEKGFDLRQDTFYLNGNLWNDHIGRTCSGEIIEAPTQSLLQRWLREQHMIYISVNPEIIGSDEWEWSYEIQHLPKEHWEAKRRCGHFVYKSSFNESPGGTYWGAWRTYEEALEKALQEALKLI